MTNKDHFERGIKEKADQMRISPSDQAWNRVQRNLNVGRRGRTTMPLYRHLTIAASLLLLLSIGVMFYLSQSPMQKKTAYEVKPLPTHMSDANLSITEINYIYQELAQHQGPASPPKIIELN